MDHKLQKRAADHGETSEISSPCSEPDRVVSVASDASSEKKTCHVWTKTKRTIYLSLLELILTEMRGQSRPSSECGPDTVLQLPFADIGNLGSAQSSQPLDRNSLLPSGDTTMDYYPSPILKRLLMASAPPPITAATTNELDQQRNLDNILSITMGEEQTEESRKDKEFKQLLKLIEETKIRETRLTLPPLFTDKPPDWLLAPVSSERHPTPTPSPLPPIPVITKEELIQKWKLMRSPPPGHVHNTLCPFWEKGDSKDVMKPQCPRGKTYTLFDINPFTKSGRELKETLDRRDRNAKAKVRTW